MNYQFDRNKVLAHLPVINNYTIKDCTEAPITVEISLTNACNHDCPGCSGFRAEGGLDSAIDTEDAMRILKEVRDCGAKAVTFTGGGDPSMHKDFDSIIKFASDLGLDIGLITNGLALKEKHFENLIPSCMWIRVSWDAATSEMHGKIHYGDPSIAPEKFWKVVSNTRALCEYRNSVNAETTVGCAFLVGPQSMEDIFGFAQLASRNLVDYCQYRPFHYIEYDEEYEIVMTAAKEEYESESMRVLFSEFKFNTLKDGSVKRTYDLCHGGHFVTHIGADYKVYVCCHLMYQEQACIGNLKEMSFQELWRSSRVSDTINGIDVHKCVPLCRNDSANRILNVIKTTNMDHRNFL
jgi:GTP 3',8-cyclase